MGDSLFVIWKQETAPVPRCDGLSGKGDRGKGRRYRQVQAPSPRDWAAALNMEAVRFRSSITCCEKGAIKKSSGPWTGRFAGLFFELESQHTICVGDGDAEHLKQTGGCPGSAGIFDIGSSPVALRAVMPTASSSFVTP